MKKTVFSILISLPILIVFLIPVSVFADGGIFIYDPDMTLWRYQDMKQQLCMINYENGIENMILSVDVDNLHGEKAVWIFPVPAKPDETTIDIIKGFPRLLGHDVAIVASENVSDVFTLMRATQIYTFPELLVSLGTARSIGGGITPHEHIEKMGLTTELITAEDESAFYDYLINKGLDLSSDFKTILKEYIGKEYSFVVSWISDIEKFKQEQEEAGVSRETINKIGVSINFPTEKIYFPLKPTSIYGDKTVPILIYVIGHVTPELYPGIRENNKYTVRNPLLAGMGSFGTQEGQVNYFIQNYYKVAAELSSFFNEETAIDNLKYTKIKINVPSKNLTEDLWIKDSVPLDVVLVESFNKHTWLGGLLFFILISCLSSMFAGMVVFRKNQPSKGKFVLFGLSNFLTLIGLAIIAYLLKINQRFTQIKEAIQPKASFGKVIKKSLLISLIISAVLLFLPLSLIIMRIFMLPGGGFFGLSEFLEFLGYILIGWAILFVITFLFITPFVWGHYNNKKIKNFTILFTIFFLTITIVLQVILQFIIS